LENDGRGVALLRLIPNVTGKKGEKHNNIIRYYIDRHSIVKCRFEAQQRYASTVARQEPWINEGEKENFQLSIINCQLFRPRSGER